MLCSKFRIRVVIGARLKLARPRRARHYPSRLYLPSRKSLFLGSRTSILDQLFVPAKPESEGPLEKDTGSHSKSRTTTDQTDTTDTVWSVVICNSSFFKLCLGSNPGRQRIERRTQWKPKRLLKARILTFHGASRASQSQLSAFFSLQ